MAACEISYLRQYSFKDPANAQRQSNYVVKFEYRGTIYTSHYWYKTYGKPETGGLTVSFCDPLVDDHCSDAVGHWQ